MRGLACAAAASVILGLAAAAATPVADPKAGDRPNLLIITLDTTRADHVGWMGSKGAKTPVLDALAASGAVFEEAHSPVPLTLPAHASIMTGRLPCNLSVRVNGLRLSGDVPTLASTLKARGYWTGAVVASVILERDRGLGRGFDVYDDRMTQQPRGGGNPEERRADEVTRAALAAVRSAKSPFFLWVHYYDPHYEYRPPEPFASAFKARPYDGEIAFMDSAIGDLIKGLEATGRMDDTLVVAAGDHGEGLGEHGEQQHGVFLYEYALHVPLFMAWKGKIPAGRRIAGLCCLTDIAPTVLDLMGLPVPEGADGTSLKGQLEGGASPARTLYAESYHGFFTYGWAPLRALLDGSRKYIDAPRPELYDWRVSEMKNLWAAEPRTVSSMKSALSRYPEADEGQRAEMEKMLKDPSNAEMLKSLMSLGYLSGGGPVPGAEGLLDPKDAIGIEEEMARARDLMDSGDRKGGEAALLSILKRNPQNVPALSMLGISYLNAGQLDRARVCFEEEVRLKPQMETGHLNLGTVYRKMGRKDLAEKEYRAALAISPRMPEAAASLAQMLIDQGRSAEARALVEPILASGVETGDLYFELGVIEAGAARWEKAKFAFTKSLAMNPRRHEALANLGRIAFQAGKVDEAVAYYQRALRVAPGNAGYLATLGSLYLNAKNDPQQALVYFQRALAADPYGPGAADFKETIAQLKAAAAEGGQGP